MRLTDTQIGYVKSGRGEKKALIERKIAQLEKASFVIVSFKAGSIADKIVALIDFIVKKGFENVLVDKVVRLPVPSDIRNKRMMLKMFIVDIMTRRGRGRRYFILVERSGKLWKMKVDKWVLHECDLFLNEYDINAIKRLEEEAM